MTGGARPSLFRGAYRLVSWSVCTLVSLYAFEEMGVAAALPTAARDLGGLAYYGWVFTGFLAASVIGMASSAYFCDRYGVRVPVLSAVALFVLGLLLAGTATTMPALVAGRVLQGLSGGALMTAVYVMAGSLIPDALRPRLFAVYSFCWVVPGILGPTVSGAITEQVGWRWIFLGLVPVAVAAAALLLPALHSAGSPADAAGSARPTRIYRAVAVAAGVCGVQRGAQGVDAVSLVVAGAGIAVLVWGLRGLLPSGTALARSGVGAAVALRGLTAAAFFGVESVLPLMMSTQHGFGPLQASIPLACAGLPCAIGSWWMGRLSGPDVLRRRIRLARRGLALVCCADLSFVWLSQPGGLGWLMSPVWVLAGLGIGFPVPAANVLVLERTTDARRAADASALQVADTTMSCLATGFSGVLVGFASRGSLGYSTAFAVIGAVMAAVALLGVLAAGRLRIGALDGTRCVTGRAGA